VTHLFARRFATTDRLVGTAASVEKNTPEFIGQ
jgi:hypothetical protein